MNAAEQLVEAFVAEGVEYVFGIPGDENLRATERRGGAPTVELPVDGEHIPHQVVAVVEILPDVIIDVVLFDELAL